MLKETQQDNPRLMRPFRKATYFEHIRCRSEEDLEADLDPIAEAAPSDKCMSDENSLCDVIF